MQIRLANENDIKDILDIYTQAKIFMRDNNNPNQWNDNYPNIDTIKEDIKDEALYVCEDLGEILGVFYYKFEADKDYANIECGQWLDDSPYGVVHRIATKRGTNGIGAYCLDYVYNLSGNLRIDTHKDNIPMRNLLKKLGFTQCGIVYIQKTKERIAFQKLKNTRF